VSDTGLDRPRRWAIAGVVGVIAVGSGLAVLPLSFTLFGAVLLVSWLQGDWDPTWNDGDGWFGAIAAVLLLLVLAATAASTGALARVGRLPARGLLAITVLATLIGAFAPIFIFWIVPRL
jgi:uncharacterized membrane protein